MSYKNSININNYLKDNLSESKSYSTWTIRNELMKTKKMRNEIAQPTDDWACRVKNLLIELNFSFTPLIILNSFHDKTI